MWSTLQRCLMCNICCKTKAPPPPFRMRASEPEAIAAIIKAQKAARPPKRIYTRDEYAIRIQKVIRGFLGRVKAKRAWDDAFDRVDDYWKSVRTQRYLEKLKQANAAIHQKQVIMH